MISRIGWWNLITIVLCGLIVVGFIVGSIGDGEFRLKSLALMLTFAVGAITFVINLIALFFCVLFQSRSGAASILSFFFAGATVYKDREFGDRTSTALKGCGIGLGLMLAGTLIIAAT